MTIVTEDKKISAMVGSMFDTEENTPEVPGHGISVLVAGLFLLGALAGAGIVAMPNVFLNAGWWAIVMIIVMCSVGCFTGFQLSWCWTILQENWPEYAEHTRNPYPEIAYRAGGNFCKYFVQTCVNLSMFGGAVAFLILSSQNISKLLNTWTGISIDYCYMLLVLAAFMLPILLLGTPKDFWPIAVGAIGATTLAIIFIMIGTIHDMPKCKGKVEYPSITTKGFISAYCTISFAYGCHSAFPTIQHDMKKPNNFPIAVLFAFIILFILYFPMPVMAYLVYGHTIQGTIDNNLSQEWLKEAIMILITGHVLFAFFIVISPVSQDLERIIGIPVEFTWKRVCTRTFMICLAVVVGLSLPDFNALLELVGGTALAQTAFVCPGPFYLMLKYKTQKPKPENGKVEKKTIDRLNSVKSTTSSFFGHESANGHEIRWYEYILNGLIVLAGLVGAFATVYNVIDGWEGLTKPCYLTGMKYKKLSQSIANNTNIEKCWADSSTSSNTTSDISRAFDTFLFTSTTDNYFFNNDTFINNSSFAFL